MRQINHREWKKSVPVASFLETGKESLRMELIAGRQWLQHHITEAAINRPGLALTGFFTHFAHRRIQVFGLAEHAFLSALEPEKRLASLRAFFEKKIPCLVVARGKKVFPEIMSLSEEHHVPVLRTRLITKHFINAATIIMENLMAPKISTQGTMIEIMGIGVLIEGRAGVGKSETALGLIEKGHALVSDDITMLRLDSAGSLIGSPVDVTRYHMEIKGVGIIHVPSLYGVASVREEKKLDLVVTLCNDEEADKLDMSEPRQRTREFFGVKIPQVMLPVAPGRSLANIVETAALDQKLRRLGHDAIKELDERLMATLNVGRVGSE